VSNGSFSVSVNGSNVGTVSSSGTGGWSSFQCAQLNADVNLNQGNNTVVLNFNSAMNVDYFQFLGAPAQPVSVKYNAAGVGSRAQVTLRAGVKGFTAVLPAGHGYTSYKLVDLQGREIRKGRIAEGATDLKFNNIGNKAVFLKLQGRNNVSTVLKAMTL
jgi:hypothetical protein